jgi:DNA-binding response OmpR family regulator
LRTLVRAQLLEEGFAVRALDSVEDALRELIRSDIQVGLMIVDVPGTATAQPLTDLWRVAGQPPVILCAGVWSQGDLNAVALPPAQVLRRPFRVGDLVERVRRIVECPEDETSCA